MTDLTTRSTHDTRFVHNIRLWGKEGQEALENSHILALGCTSATCQSIKNLVLPGAGAFTLVDDRKVTLAEAQTNFFLSYGDAGTATKRVGEPLVECAKVTLVDLHQPNEETGGVTGVALQTNPNAFVTADTAKFAAFLKEKNVNVILIAASVVSEATIGTLAAVIEGDEAAFGRILVLVLHVSGYIGAIRMSSVRDATIVKSIKDSDQTFDTRYSDPFPALREWMDAHYPDNVIEAERTRIPYFVLAYHALVAYNEKYVPDYKRQRTYRDGHVSGDFTTDPTVSLKVPNESKEWGLAQECLREDVCTVEIKNIKVQVLDDQDETYNDAMQLLTRAKGDLKAREVYELKKVWERADFILHTQKSEADLYWFVAKAIQAFKTKNNNNLPLSTEIPDFHTNTEWYRELVSIYKAESQREIEEVAATARQLLSQVGKTTVDDEALLAMCKKMVPHSRYLAITSYVQLSAEYANSRTPTSGNNGNATTMGTPSGSACSSAPAKGVKLSYSPENGLHDPCGFYIALKVAQAFASAEGRYPGSVNDDATYEADQRSVVAKYSADPADTRDVVDADCNWVTSTENIAIQIEEVVRGGGGELITTAAIVGALAAQEVIKYVQQRYIPSGSLIVFDGHESLTHCVGVAAN